MPRTILIGFGVDVDAVAGWLGSYGGEDSPLDVSRGMYAGEVGVPRLLKLFKKYGITTSWFIPGHSLETFPKEMAAVRDAGHEMFISCLALQNPSEMSLEQQRDILDHTYKLLTDFNFGKPPKGSVAPWWETSKEGTALLLQKGIEYDLNFPSSQAYYLRDEDYWTKIDYSAKAETWMKPLTKGNETGIVEIPANWCVSLFQSSRIFIADYGHSQVNVRDVEQLWKDTFTYLYREEESFIFPITIHPDVSGVPDIPLTYRVQERFIEWVNTHADVKWATMYEMSGEFRSRADPPAGAQMPKGFVKKTAN
ncbi:carbohydrate esterase family 4 protein [Lanmaoa asiatica]|nr:carbohydrate esterase family 4 protein [Lanmaoa asiatica]